jgi:molybdopterin-synthase adenylyltransferase
VAHCCIWNPASLRGVVRSKQRPVPSPAPYNPAPYNNGLQASGRVISLELDERYSRQILFRGVGRDGQQKLSAAQVAIVGCGATGSALASLLARSGVGTIRIIDRDYVEASNLQRQTLFDEADARESLPKAVAAARKIAAFNSQIVIEPQVADLTPANVDSLLGGVSLILDGTDNFETRYLINDFAVKNSLPWIYTAAVGSYGVTMNILPGQTACLVCIFPQPPQGILETCDTAGILNSAVNLAASLAATEALKLLVGADAQLRRTLLSFDLWSNTRGEVAANLPHPGCRACGRHEFSHLDRDEQSRITLCGRNAVQIHEHRHPVDLAEMSERLKSVGRVKHNAFVLKFWHDPYEMTLFPDGRAIIKGTSDTAAARTFYARYIGN